jgi:hypothetical protein
MCGMSIELLVNFRKKAGSDRNRPGPPIPKVSGLARMLPAYLFYIL